MKSRIAFKFALTIMIVGGLGVSLLAWLSYKEADTIFREHSANNLAVNSRMYAQKISKEIGTLKYDLTMLSLDDSVKGLMRALEDPYLYDRKTNKTAEQFRQEIADLFVVMAEQNVPYFQIRIIDAQSGMELVRVEKNRQGTVTVLPDEKLQNKAHRQYVQESLKLSEGEVYLSPITLNREYRTIETPYRPTIRASRLLKHEGNDRLIVIINADIKKLFDFSRFFKEEEITTFVADEHGYYLFNPLEPYKEFAFEFGQPYKITDDFEIASIYEGKRVRLAWYDDKKEMLYEALKIPLDKKRFLVVVKGANSLLYKEQSRDYILKLMIYVVMVAFIIALAAAVAAWRISRPIVELSKAARHIAETGGRESVKIDIETHDEIEELAHSFEAMLDALLKSREEIEQFAQKLEGEVERKTRDLQRLNEELEKKVQEGIEELRKKERALMQRSKLADMGEMIGAIAHQWRQPLNALALNIQMLEDMAVANELDEKNIDAFIEKNMKTIQFMSKTIDDFRNFYREEKEEQRFDLKQAIEDTVNLQKAQLEARHIEVTTDLEPIVIKGYRNDLMQVVLNLVSNARDAILQRREKERDFKGKIHIMCKKEGNEAIIKISDNAGGVPEALLERIFEPYFTTKEEGKGTGLGLHMSKRIIEEKMHGTLEVRNSGEGAEFVIRLRLNDAHQTE